MLPLHKHSLYIIEILFEEVVRDLSTLRADKGLSHLRIGDRLSHLGLSGRNWRQRKYQQNILQYR